MDPYDEYSNEIDFNTGAEKPSEDDSYSNEYDSNDSYSNEYDNNSTENSNDYGSSNYDQSSSNTSTEYSSNTFGGYSDQNISKLSNEDEELEKILSNKPEKELLKDLNKITSECNSHFEYQKEMLGLGHAILQGEKRIARGTFAVILPDDLCHNQGLSIISQLKTLHDKFPDKCIVAVEEVDFSNVERYGIIGGSFIDKEKKIYQVDKMIEKPKTEYAPSNMAIIGRYILTSEVFKKLKAIKKDKRGEIQITNALNALAKEGKVLAYKFDGLRIDCGSVDGFVEANNFFYSLLKK